MNTVVTLDTAGAFSGKLPPGTVIKHVSWAEAAGGKAPAAVLIRAASTASAASAASALPADLGESLGGLSLGAGAEGVPPSPGGEIRTAVPPSAAPPSLGDLVALRREAEELAAKAVEVAESREGEETRALGARLAAEQARLYASVMAAVPAAVRRAASQGKRVATVLAFKGGDTFEEFTTLYMLRGPRDRQELRSLGLKPVIHRLRADLGDAGFGVHHSWQRATNHNELSVSW